jgi:hypothetical protein
MHITTSHTSNNNRNGEHILLSLTYIGRNSEKNNGIELTRILERWRRNNEKSDITSALAINDNYLIQNIEGSRPIINEVLAILINDYPHLLPHIIGVEEIEVRRWNGFLIKYLTPSVEDEEYTLKSFSAGADFNPYLMKSTQITSFLKTIFEDTEFNKS